MRVAVTGQFGQVVTSLVERAAARDSRIEIIRLGRPDFDLSRGDTIAGALEETRPDVVVSAAAYTAVDRAESESDLAYAVNATGAGAVAAAAEALGKQVIHISTDYVFDGSKPTPYVESDPVMPLGVYGASKLAGERAVLAAAPGAIILRTAWVYSPFGTNFVKTMLRVAGACDEVRVVDDQRGCPTSALDIADAVLEIARRLVTDPDGSARGVFHLAGSGEGSWADVAQAVFDASQIFGGPVASVKRITTADYPTPVERPVNSRLNCALLAQNYGLRLPDWRDSVAVTVKRLIRSDSSGD